MAAREPSFESILTPTGFHATDSESFAAAIHEALSLSPAQQLKMREAARALAESKFSEAEFERGFERGWERLVHRAEERIGAAMEARGEEVPPGLDRS
jgi:alpha-1,2-mannosyltransferase